jgi:hypothetical protein
MRPSSAVLALLIALGPSVALADPVGKYQLRGTNPDNSGEYAGTVSVTRTGDTYKVVWSIGDTQTIGVGIGGRMVGEGYQMGPASEEDSILSVAYKSGDTVGTAIYYEDPDGVWRGAWAYDGSTQSATESWTPTKKKKKQVAVDARAVKPQKSLSTPLPAQNGPKQ